MKNTNFIVFRKCVRGGALYYAIFVMLLLSLLSISLLSYFELGFREDARFYKQTELNDNIQSALTLICCQPNLLKENTVTNIDVFNDETAFVQVIKQRWGFLNLIKLNAGWRNLFVKRTTLVAEKEEKRPALWMPDQKRYVSLVGNSYINGNCFLSELGLRKGNAEGRYFEGPYLHKGQLEKSPPEMPAIKDEIRNFFSQYQIGNASGQDSLVRYESLSLNEPIIQSFTGKTLCVQSSRRLVLDEGVFDGNIVIVTSDTIEVWPTVTLNHCILIGKGIEIKEGFKGKTQAVATQSVEIGKGCELNYPSFVGVISATSIASVKVEGGSVINGGLVCYSEVPQEGETRLVIGNGTKIIGKTYVNGDLTFEGHISGSLYCNRFVNRTSRAFYENFMIDCSVDEPELPREYASFCIFEDVFKLREVKSW